MPMACPSEQVIHELENVQHSLLSETIYNNFLNIGSYFTDSSIKEYIWITADYDLIPFYEIPHIEKNPGYGFSSHKYAYPGQPLVLEHANAKTVLFEAADHPENRTALSIDGVDYSSVLENIPNLGWSSFAQSYVTADLNSSDNSTEILLFYGTGASSSNYAHILSLEGDTLTYIGSFSSYAMRGDIIFHGDGTFTAICGNQYIENNYIAVTYSINTGSVTQVPQEEYPLLSLHFLDVIKDLEVYTTPDTGETYYLYHDIGNYLDEYLYWLNLAG